MIKLHPIESFHPMMEMILINLFCYEHSKKEMLFDYLLRKQN